MSKIGFIGAGNMAEAIIKGVIDAHIYHAEDIIISDVRKDRLNELADKYGISFMSNMQLAEAVDILVLSVKPQNMTSVLNEIKNSLCETLMVSIAAGITTGSICNTLGYSSVIRVMPNTPALIGQGTAVLYATKEARERLSEVERIFSAVGLVAAVEDEKLLDAVTAVSGSGPAYFFLLMEEMIKTAEKMGLGKELAEKIVLQTAKGAAMLAIERAKTGEKPEVLRQKVTSPNGTTEAALKVFAKNDFSKIVSEALAAAEKRSKELSGN
ncbi:MAG: Pyrroline-5-carboxylate reductase [Planctomycetes bacterium ADurb.Bin401]|nr:MAG: Pyrroline-5-carboxylate reductase [Planctomycetes bacterium ADurb.Bin401]